MSPVAMVTRPSAPAPAGVCIKGLHNEQAFSWWYMGVVGGARSVSYVSHDMLLHLLYMIPYHTSINSTAVAGKISLCELRASCCYKYSTAVLHPVGITVLLLSIIDISSEYWWPPLSTERS